jgi:hypothetical protein
LVKKSKYTKLLKDVQKQVKDKKLVTKYLKNPESTVELELSPQKNLSVTVRLNTTDLTYNYLQANSTILTPARKNIIH